MGLCWHYPQRKCGNSWTMFNLIALCVCFSSIVWVAYFVSSKLQHISISFHYCNELVSKHKVWSFCSLREDDVCYMFALGSIRLQASLALVLETIFILLGSIMIKKRFSWWNFSWGEHLLWITSNSIFTRLIIKSWKMHAWES